MIGQTVGSLLHLPGASDVLAAGITPLTGGSPFTTVEYRKNGTTTVVFEHVGVLYLYSMGTAAKANLSASENVFIELICEIISEYRPENLYVATFSRLIRAMEFSSRLYTAVKNDVDVVHCGTTTIDVRTQSGKAQWSVYSMVADMERDSIVQRLFAGTVNKYLSGKWHLSENMIPPGYLLGQDGVVRPDSSQQQNVRLLLEALADESYTSSQVIKLAGRLRFSSKTLQRIYGPDATYADISRPHSKVMSLMDWLPTYATGVAEITQVNPFPGAKCFRTLKVEYGEEDRCGIVRFRYEWGLPAGGWAPAEVISAAMRRTRGRKERTGSGGAGHQERKPLAGDWSEWSDGSRQFHIGGTTQHYIVLQRPLLTEGDNK
jgi:DNA invertase Pin-like site-specific DNA recombinase